jgi:acyl-CoA reductase-like NAD-dependent aldehyde dehydrogenase
MNDVHPLLINGRWVLGEGGTVEVRNPYNDALVGRVSLATKDQAAQAIEGAAEAFRRFRSVSARGRSRWLARTSELIAERSEELARIIAQEVAKPLKTARVEVARATMTFQIGAEEATRLGGEVIPMDAVLGSEGRVGYAFRQPVGPVLAITPWSFAPPPPRR